MIDYETLVTEVVRRVKAENLSFEVEASGRHIHLSKKHLEALFGEGYQLTPAKELSQPGQFASKERITIAGPKGIFQNVIILGPERSESQVELSLTDARSIGVNPPVRESGDIIGTPGVVLLNGTRSVSLETGLIIAKRHIHMTPEDADKNQVSNHQIVKVAVDGARPLIFDDVVVRVSPKFATFMHIDYDEANACGHHKGVRGRIVL